MKNRMYYLLVLCYIAVVGIILYINGVFTGDIPDQVNLIINLVFLLIIGIIFCITAPITNLIIFVIYFMFAAIDRYFILYVHKP